MIAESVRKTGRLLVVHGRRGRGGFGAEIVRQVVEKAFESGSAPIVLGGANTPIPFSGALEDACLPQVVDIIRLIRKLVG